MSFNMPQLNFCIFDHIFLWPIFYRNRRTPLIWPQHYRLLGITDLVKHDIFLWNSSQLSTHLANSVQRNSMYKAASRVDRDCGRWYNRHLWHLIAVFVWMLVFLLIQINVVLGLLVKGCFLLLWLLDFFCVPTTSRERRIWRVVLYRCMD